MNEDILKEIEFSELGKIITGKTPKTKIDEYWNGIIPFITPKDIQVNKYINFTERYISDAGLHTVSSQYLPKNSISVSCIGNIGYVGLTTKESISNQQINTIIPNNNFDNHYVFYLMKNYWPIFKSLENQSTTISILNKSHFSSLKVKVINDKIKQKAIANILSSLDDKIELNNKINQNLESLAQTLYKHWFVDFEFPNENGEPYKSSGGEMVDSELGLIPKGWEVKSLIESINISYGKNYPTTKLLDSGYPVFGGNGIIGYSETYLYEEPKVIVSCRGAASGTVLNTLKKSFVTNNSLILEDNENISYEFLRAFSVFRKFFDFTTGSAQPQITITSIGQCKIILPMDKTMTQFKNSTSNLYKKIENIYYENQKLAELRDTLLPKLMNGEIEVPV